MTKKVGMTSDPARRERDKRREDPGIRNWKIKAENLTRSQAQELENKLGKKPGHESNPGGRKPNNPKAKYSVYTHDE